MRRRCLYPKNPSCVSAEKVTLSAELLLYTATTSTAATNAVSSLTILMRPRFIVRDAVTICVPTVSS